MNFLDIKTNIKVNMGLVLIAHYFIVCKLIIQL